MTQNIFAAIRRACLEIAYDNGGVNRDRSAKQVEREISSFLANNRYADFLSDIDAWLAGLSKEQFETICNGEHREIEALIVGAPPFTDELLNLYFDEVC